MTRASHTADFLVAVQPGATALSPARDEVVSFDLEGRPISWMSRGRTFKRSLASDVVGRRTVDGVRRRWRLDDASASRHFARAAEVGAAAARALDRGDLRASGGTSGPPLRPLKANEEAELRERLERVAGWSPERLVEERQRFAGVYRPVSILPPDQYHAVVLQATYGCSWNRCTFCTFYQDRPFEVRTPAAFAEHVAGVAELLGRGATLRKSIFLADGNALVLSNDRLRPLFAAARERFPDRPVSGFVDVFGGERKSVAAWSELTDEGLRRVALGVETGSDALLAYLNKPGGAAEALEVVGALKAAGLAVAVILMIGAGGARFAREHERGTLALLERLPLGRGDIVYLSPFVVQPGTPYAARAQADGIAPLTREEREAQYARLRAAARAAAPGVRVTLYAIDEFVY